MTAKSQAERKKDERDRKRATGLKRFEDWIYPEDEKRIRKYIERLKRSKG